MKIRQKMIICLLAVGVITSAASRESTHPQLKQSTISKLREKLSDRSGKPGYPPFETFIIEDNRGQEIPVSHVRLEVISDSEHWMRELVRSEWLPVDIPSQLKARKDAFVREIPTLPGYTPIKEYGDFLILDYEIKSHRILLIESGKRISARIQLPEAVNLAKVSASDVLKLVSTFFTMPKGAIPPDDIEIKGDDQLRLFRWTKGPTQEEISKRFVKGERLDWWIGLQLHFDGQTLLISLPEISDPSKLSPRLTLQDRF